jgi:hypothetical protein
LLLALVGIAALSPVAGVSAQDQSRICLTEAILHGRISNDPCFVVSADHSAHDGHLYSDKAPGVSILQLPAAAVLRPGAPQGWSSGDLRVWGIRVLSVGLAFLLCAFLVGRVAEGLAPGFGAISLVTFALGTLVAPLAAVSYEHVAAAALAFAAFLLAWARRHGLAGLAAGAAVLVEYECGLVVVVLACYVALRGWGQLARFVAGLLPSAALLGAYDWAAFGAPWHLSYNYLGSYYASYQGRGLFGIGLPTRPGVIEVFAGTGGLLVVSPVLVMAALGLVRLWRRYPAETAVAAVVSAAYVLANTGYFQPYGGASPGPRFLTAALPFLALGLGPAFAWRPRLTLALAILSIIPMTAITLTWSSGSAMSRTVWVQLARVPAELGSSTFVRSLSANALSALGPGRDWGAAMVGLSALAALLVAARAMPWAQIRRAREEGGPRRRPPLRSVLVGAVCVYLVVVSDVLAFSNYPYGDRPPRLQLVALHTSISAPSPDASPGGEVNFTVSVVDNGPIGAGRLRLHLSLSPGLRLVGRPRYTLGSGCTGNSTLVCNLGFLSPNGHETAQVFFGVQVTQPASQNVTAYSSGEGDPRSNLASYAVSVG